MADVELLLSQAVRAIEPTREQKTAASRSHHYLRDLMHSGRMEARLLDHFLSGSYVRTTAIQPLEDVDVIFVVDPAYWKSGLFTRFPPPEAVLKTFEGALRWRYPQSGVRMQRRSVGLRMNHLDIDVVPAFYDSASDRELLRIPDRTANSWILTAPQKHTGFATQINQAQGGLFKPVVKLLKCWNVGGPAGAQFKSFCVETLAAHLFRSVRINSLEYGVFAFWDFVCFLGGKTPQIRWSHDLGLSLGYWRGCNVPDLTGLGNVASGVKEEQRSRFVERAERSRGMLQQARAARTLAEGQRKVESAFGRMLREMEW